GPVVPDGETRGCAAPSRRARFRVSRAVRPPEASHVHPAQIGSGSVRHSLAAREPRALAARPGRATGIAVTPMFRAITPHLFLTSVLELDVGRLRVLGIDGLLLDVDGTLKDYRAHEVPAPVREWVVRLKAN